MPDQVKQIARRLQEKGAETVAFFRGLAPEDWEKRVYTEGTRWDVRRVLCHFVSAERSFLRLFEDIMAGGEGTPEDFDLDRFNESQVAKMDGLSPEELIRRFEEARAAMVAFVEGLSEADLEREGRHPFFGMDRLEKFLKLVYRHNMIHERDVRRALEEA